MKKLLVIVCASTMLLTAVPSFTKASEEQNRDTRERQGSIRTIQKFSPYLYEELQRLQTIVDNLKAEDPSKTEEIKAMEEIVKKQQDFITSQEQRLIKLTEQQK